jgi:hypothetical protein
MADQYLAIPISMVAYIKYWTGHPQGNISACTNIRTDRALVNMDFDTFSKDDERRCNVASKHRAGHGAFGGGSRLRQMDWRR